MLGTKKEKRIRPELISMALTLLPSKLVALRRRMTSFIRGCTQPESRRGVSGLAFCGVAASFRGVRLSAGRVTLLLENGDVLLTSFLMPAAVCATVCDDGMMAVEDIVSSRSRADDTARAAVVSILVLGASMRVSSIALSSLSACLDCLWLLGTYAAAKLEFDFSDRA